MIDFIEPDYTLTFVAITCSVLVLVISVLFFVFKWFGAGFIALTVGLLLVLVSGSVTALIAQDNSSLLNIRQVENYLEDEYEGDFRLEAHNPRQLLRAGEYMKKVSDVNWFDVKITVDGKTHTYELDIEDGKPAVGNPLQFSRENPTPKVIKK